MIMPMYLFLILGTIQLGMMHQARLMTEYAAYRAARVGAVNHGDCTIMKNSALVALLPTFGPRVDTIDKLGMMYARLKIPYGDKHPMGMTAGQIGMRVGYGLDIVTIEVHNPKRSQLASLFNTYGVRTTQGLPGSNLEIDWDDIRDNTVVGANLLSVKVKYYYQLRIPFVNWLIQLWTIGYEYLKDVRGYSIGTEKAFYGTVTADAYLKGRALMKGGDFVKLVLYARSLRYYLLPIVGTYSMRMQSNLFRNRVQPCAVN